MASFQSQVVVIATAAVFLLFSAASARKTSLRPVVRSGDNCPGALVSIMVTNAKITYADRATTTILTGDIDVKRDTLVKSLSLKIYRDGPIPMMLAHTKYDDFCKEVASNTNIYLNFVYQSGGIPRTCSFKKGVYPGKAVVNMSIPMEEGAASMMSGVVFLQGEGFGADKTQVVCLQGRVELRKVKE